MSCSGWGEIYGQERPIAFLRACLARREVPHALLFTGPRGVGKFSTALLFAAALFCPSGEPDGCPSCLKVARRVHPDLHVLEAEGNVIRREQITELERELSRKPAEAGKRVALIDEAQLMNVEASNAFLKTLEEPPPETYLLLVVENKESLMPTVESRCHEVRFSTLGKKDIRDYLTARAGLDEMDAERVARLSGGLFGRALLWARNPEFARHWNRGVEIAARMRRYSLLEALEKVEEARRSLRDAAAASEERERESYLQAMDRQGRERLEKRWQEREKRENAKAQRQAAVDFLDGMSSFYRDIMLLNLMQEGAGEPSETPLLNLEWREELEREALHIGARESKRCLETLLKVKKALEANVDLGLLLDNLVLELKSAARP
jgi:DNA polymerase-3 subunit delta'